MPDRNTSWTDKCTENPYVDTKRCRFPFPHAPHDAWGRLSSLCARTSAPRLRCLPHAWGKQSMGRSASPLDDGMPRHASGARQNLRATEPDEEPSGRMASTTDSDSDTSIGCDRVSNLPARTMTQGSEASIAPTEPRTPAQMDDAEADRTGNVWHAESPVAPLQSPDPPQRDRRLYFTGEQVKCAPSEIAHSGTKKQLAWPLIDNPPPTVPACPDLVPFPGPRDGQHALADTCGDRDSSVGGCRGGTNRLPSPIVEGINWGCSRACCTLRNTSRNRTMAMMVLINWFLFMDQNLMAPNLSDMARDFGMTDDERDVKLGGQISMSLFLVGTPVSLVVGHYADRVNRKALYTAVVMCGEVGCLLTFLVKEYWQLFVLRALTGVSLGGALPLVFSMISDMYPAHERPRATAMMGLSCGVGVGTGQLVAAVLGGGPSGWRLPFVVVSAPCLLALLVFHFVAREPTRASQETIFQEIMRDAGEGKGDLEAGTGLVKAREGAGTEQGPHMARMPSCRARSESPCQRRFPDAASGHRALAPSERGVASSAWGSTSLRRHCRVQSDDMRWWGGSSTEQPMSLGRGDGHRRNLSNGSMLSSDGAGVVHRRNPSWEMWGWGVQERPMRCGLGDGHRRNLSKLSSVSTDGAGVVHRRNQSRGRGHHRMHSDGSVVVANLGAAAVGAEEECGKEAPFERVVSIPEAVNGDAVQNVEEGQRKATGVFGGCMQFSRDVARLFRRRSNVLIFCQVCVV